MFLYLNQTFKNLIYISLIFILSNCQLKEPIKSHGINFLENRSKKYQQIQAIKMMS